MMRLQWTSELDIDALEAKRHWATLEELLEVVGRFLPRYESVLKSCKEKPGAVLSIDLSFATNVLAVYSFIKVKGSRPMTSQYLTVEMVNKAKTNGGFIDQKMFKTAESDVHPCRRQLSKSRHRSTRLWPPESNSQGSRISFSRGKTHC